MRLSPLVSSLKVNRRIAFVFALAIALISGGFALSLYSYGQSQRSSEQTLHTFRIINILEEILSLTKDIETGTRGYLASYDPIFLESRSSVLTQIGPQLQRLRKLTKDNPAQLRAIDTLATLINAKIDISHRQVLFTSQSPDSLIHATLLIGKQRMDRVRQQTAHMIKIEQATMLQRSRHTSESFRNTLVLIFTLSLLTFVVLLIAHNMLDNELNQRLDNETKLRQYEADLKQNIQQLEVSNQELERFAFVASHDMQEPLRKIQTFGNLLAQQYPMNIDENGHVYLQKMLTSADRMSKLIRDLLSFSRLKNQPDAFQRLSVSAVLNQVLSDLEIAIETKNASVSVGTMPILEVVPSQFEQLLTNLIGNALKYTRPDVSPVISITSSRVDPALYSGLLTDRPYHQLTITDNGIGFDEKYLDRIFEVFQRLHAKERYEGTGIGLAICKRVVAYHNGHITARSQEGVGTTFIIVLPEFQTAPVGQEQPSLVN